MHGFEPAAIEARIRAYERFGIHRTGWPGDEATSEWLIEELGRLGVAAAIEPFTFPRVETRRARLSWGSGPRDHADGVPMYDGGFTPTGGIEGELVSDEDGDRRGKIVVLVSAAARGPAGNPPAGARETFGELARAGAVGAVVPTGEGSSIRLRNAEYIEGPFSLPVLQVAPGDVRDLAAALASGVAGTLEIDGERRESTATNVVASIAGTDPEAAPLLVITPKSGWFTCAAERGGGVAVWLALAGHFARVPPRREVHLLASSGHELHHQGLEHWLRSRTALVRRAVLTLHLGASIGARYPDAEYGTSSAALHDLTRDALLEEGIGPQAVTPAPPGEAGGGEARNIDEVGGRFVSLRGYHRYFHMPDDTFDRAVDAEAVARYARAARRVVDAALAQADEDREAAG